MSSWLQSWLSNLNLAEYEDTLSQRGYTSPESLASIVEREQLKAIGVTKMGHLSRLFRAIEKVRSDMGTGGEGEKAAALENSEVNSMPPRVTATLSAGKFSM